MGETLLTLYIKKKEKIYRVAKSYLSVREDAEDIVQEVYLKISALHHGRIANPEGFLMTITRNLCIDKLRKRKNVSERDNIPEALMFSRNEDKAIDNRDLGKIAFNIIETDLTESQRIVIKLRDVEGYEFVEISQITGLSEDNVRMTLSRARKTIREKMLKVMNYGS